VYYAAVVLSQSRDAAITAVPVKAIESFDSHRRIVTKIGPNTSSLPCRRWGRRWQTGWGRNHHP